MTTPEQAVHAMPERIYAKVHGASTDLISGQRGLIGGWNEHKRDGQAEYVRADLYAALEAQLAEARKALDGLLKPFEGDDCRYDHHGYCQAHFLQEVDECCVKIARRVLEGGEANG